VLGDTAQPDRAGRRDLQALDVMNIRRIEIFGVPVDCVTLTGALDFVDNLIAADRQGAILAVNPEKVMRAQTDPELRARLHSTALLIPDGIGVVTAARVLGLARIRDRLPGADLMVALCEHSAARGYRIFMFGARSEVNQRAREVLRQTYPALKIVGGRHGYIGEKDMPDLIDEINEARADILFVALGSPRQEQWICRWLPSLRVKVCQGVGGTFDVIAGAVPRAPLFIRSANLEWAYRLLRQPSRLVRQTALPRFAWRVLATRLGLRHPG
jgi:N-acetylglucosaminyldiphosphoundecaprenol N-acetyl-beta-D-mannosaminyltransferase